MRSYLNGYLDVLPDSQKAKIESLIRSSNAALDTGNIVTEDQYIALIKEITTEHQELSVEIPQTDRVDPRLYNQFFGNLQVDMNLMFLESELINQAVNNYERLYDGIIGELGKEIKALQDRIGSLRLVAEGEQGLIVKTVDFINTTFMETDRGSFAHMFKDRDGSDIPDVIIERNVDHSYITLGKLTNIDYMHDASGATTATIAIVDQRGLPVTQTSYPPANAIDNSSSTYWAEVVLVDDQINVALDDVSAGGALVKLQIILSQPQIVNQISLSPFTTYPLQIASLKYEEDINTFHVPKELLSTDKVYEDTNTMTIQFPNIVAKRFTLILRQKNFIKDSYLVSKDDIAKADLWDKISKRETEATLGTPPVGPNAVANATTASGTLSQSQVDTISGWDIYLQQLAKYKAEYATWQQNLQAYNAWQVQYSAYQSAQSNYAAQVASINASYGTYY